MDAVRHETHQVLRGEEQRSAGGNHPHIIPGAARVEAVLPLAIGAGQAGDRHTLEGAGIDIGDPAQQ